MAGFISSDGMCQGRLKRVETTNLMNVDNLLHYSGTCQYTFNHSCYANYINDLCLTMDSTGQTGEMVVHFKSLHSITKRYPIANGRFSVPLGI